MDIQEFLRSVKEDEVATATGASVHTVRKWRTGDRVPGRKMALALVEWSHGVLTLESILAAQPRRAA